MAAARSQAWGGYRSAQALGGEPAGESILEACRNESSPLTRSAGYAGQVAAFYISMWACEEAGDGCSNLTVRVLSCVQPATDS